MCSLAQPFCHWTWANVEQRSQLNTITQTTWTLVTPNLILHCVWWSVCSRVVNKICSVLLQSIRTLHKIMSMFNCTFLFMLSCYIFCWLSNMQRFNNVNVSSACAQCVACIGQLYHIFSTSAACCCYYSSFNLCSVTRNRLIVRSNLDSVLKSTLSDKLFHALKIVQQKSLNTHKLKYDVYTICTSDRE